MAEKKETKKVSTTEKKETKKASMADITVYAKRLAYAWAYYKRSGRVVPFIDLHCADMSDKEKSQFMLDMFAKYRPNKQIKYNPYVKEDK